MNIRYLPFGDNIFSSVSKRQDQFLGQARKRLQWNSDVRGSAAVRFEETKCDTVSYRVRKQIYGRSVL